MTIPSLHLVRYDTVEDFADAMEPHDDSSMNFALGSLLDSMLSDTKPDVPSNSRTLLAVYRQDDLLLTLTKATSRALWVLSCPSTLPYSTSTPANPKSAFTSASPPGPDPGLVAAAAQLLASSLPHTTDPAFVAQLTGPEHAVSAFLSAWLALMERRGVHLRAHPPTLTARCCSATRATLSAPPTPSSPTASIALASTPADAEAVAPLALAFNHEAAPHPAGAASVRATILAAVRARRVWLCRADGGALAGYVLVGRATPRTAAIRNVYVRPEFRRQGLAETMVRAVTRTCLGLGPVPDDQMHAWSACADDAVAVGPGVGAKQEVCLLVADPAVERIYRRCGFIVMEDGRDPDTGGPASYVSVLRSVTL